MVLLVWSLDSSKLLELWRVLCSGNGEIVARSHALRSCEWSEFVSYNMDLINITVAYNFVGPINVTVIVFAGQTKIEIIVFKHNF